MNGWSSVTMYPLHSQLLVTDSLKLAHSTGLRFEFYAPLGRATLKRYKESVHAKCND